MRHYFVANFLKDITFINETTIQTAGAGNAIYECLVSNGKIVKKV